ncbi:hypothetical protein WA158_004186 [Blastocystis sp. Blastoise]
MNCCQSGKCPLNFIKQYKPVHPYVTKIEETIKVPFEYLFLGVVAVILLILFFIMKATNFVNTFIFFPALVNFLIDISKGNEKSSKWISFWILFSFVSVNGAFFEHYIPAFNLIKLIVFLALAFTDYVSIVYEKGFVYISEQLVKLWDLYVENFVDASAIPDYSDISVSEGYKSD